MSKKKRHKNKGLRFPCPLCFDNGDVADLIIKKSTYKSTSHVLMVNQKGELYIDYSSMIGQEPRKVAVSVECKKCNHNHVYSSEESLLEDFKPMLEYIRTIGFGKELRHQAATPKLVQIVKNGKHKNKEEKLPEIVRPGDLAHEPSHTD